MFTLAVKKLGRTVAVSVEDRRVHLKETRTAVNRAALRRKKRNGRRCSASGAVYGNLDTLFDTRTLRGGYCSEPLILGLLAFLASFRWILKFFVPKEYLFAGRPDKVGIAINTQNGLVLKFGFYGL